MSLGLPWWTIPTADPSCTSKIPIAEWGRQMGFPQSRPFLSTESSVRGEKTLSWSLNIFQNFCFCFSGDSKNIVVKTTTASSNRSMAMPNGHDWQPEFESKFFATTPPLWLVFASTHRPPYKLYDHLHISRLPSSETHNVGSCWHFHLWRFSDVWQSYLCHPMIRKTHSNAIRHCQYMTGWLNRNLSDQAPRLAPVFIKSVDWCATCFY